MGSAGSIRCRGWAIRAIVIAVSATVLAGCGAESDRSPASRTHATVSTDPPRGDDYTRADPADPAACDRWAAEVEVARRQVESEGVALPAERPHPQVEGEPIDPSAYLSPADHAALVARPPAAAPRWLPKEHAGSQAAFIPLQAGRGYMLEWPESAGAPRLTISFWYFDADDLDQREKGEGYDPPEPVPDPNVVKIRGRSGEVAHVADAEVLVWMFDPHYEVQVETDVFNPAINCQELLAIARSVEAVT